MSKTTQNEAPQVAQVLAKVLDGEKQFASEKRSDSRAPLFVPVKVIQTEYESTVSGFTRDISAHGVCLIMPQPYRPGTIAQVNVSGLTSEESSLAKCNWSAKFGNAYWVSGWRLSREIPVGRLLKEDRLLEPEQRGSDRLQAAVPVSIYLPGKTGHVAGFTRNLARDGVCLVSKVETQPGQLAQLEVMMLGGESNKIQSCCLWAKHYGEDNWVSGWQFSV